METYKFETTVLPSGMVKIPSTLHLENEKIDVVLTVKRKSTSKEKTATSVDDFLKKWVGVIKGAQIDNYRDEYYSHIKEKHA